MDDEFDPAAVAVRVLRADIGREVRDARLLVLVWPPFKEYTALAEDGEPSRLDELPSPLRVAGLGA